MIGILIGIIVLIFWVWGLIDVIKADNAEFTVIAGENAKLIWLLIILILPLIGTILYMVLEKRMLMKPGFSAKRAKEDILGSGESSE